MLHCRFARSQMGFCIPLALVLCAILAALVTMENHVDWCFQCSSRLQNGHVEAHRWHLQFHLGAVPIPGVILTAPLQHGVWEHVLFSEGVTLHI